MDTVCIYFDATSEIKFAKLIYDALNCPHAECKKKRGIGNQIDQYSAHPIVFGY